MSFHELLLGRGDFLNHDTGHRAISGVSIRTRFFPHAVSHIDSHSHGSLGDSFTVSSNLSCSVYVVICFAVVHMNVSNTINGERFATFHTIEGEIPALAAIQAECNSVVTIVLDFQSCVISKLVKDAVLKLNKITCSGKTRVILVFLLCFCF